MSEAKVIASSDAAERFSGSAESLSSLDWRAASKAIVLAR
eukprot:CAMPEP_0183353068 /NCGR_PEP_ID=MMETSP0164_2-20130417/32504_1 /TAXON_ID=221442 /ORGANISM="Coccolithus pelagicus ssp braarudi, Strain PLY182g" /LENGTH=39 /DNA_ID= /DNA_START= /DNA_END= /DNA_ORIENTATION=